MTGRRSVNRPWVALALVISVLALVPAGPAVSDPGAARFSNPLYDIKTKYGRSAVFVAGESTRVKVVVHNKDSKPLDPQTVLLQLVGDASSRVKVKIPTVAPRSKETVAVDFAVPADTRTGSRGFNGCTAVPHTQHKCGPVRSHSQITVLAPAHATILPSSFVFGTTATGTQSTPKALTVRNNGDVATSSIGVSLTGAQPDQFTKSGDTCSGHPLAPGATCTVSVTFTPTTQGSKTASVSVTGTPGGTTNASISGTGANPAAVAFSPLEHSFGDVVTGMTATQLFTVTNSGGVPTGTLTTSITGDDASHFDTSEDNCDTHTLAAGASCTMTVLFAPTASGARTASVQVTGTPGGTATAQLSGTGLNPAALGISPTQHAFPVRATGTTGDAKSFTVTNTGQAPTGALSASLANGDKNQFALSDNTCDGQMLAPAASCSVTVSFAPTTTGVKAVSLQVSATPGGSATASLSGTGANPAALSISPMVKDFGTVSSGAPAGQTFTITNTGGVTTGTLSAVLESATPGQFTIAENTCGGQTLAAGLSCAVSVSFAPTSPGAKTGTLTVMATPGGSAVASLSGSGG